MMLSPTIQLSHTDYIPSPEFSLLCHRVYEYQKGIRPLFLCTFAAEIIEQAVQKLAKCGIDYYLQNVPGSRGRVNLFFGRSECVNAVRVLLPTKTLSTLSAEEDFIIGAMLGYDMCMQCDRYCKRKKCRPHP